MTSFVGQTVERELAAVVLSPVFRDPRAAPAPKSPHKAHIEGAISRDAPFISSVRVELARKPAGIRQPRARGYALTRFETPASGSLQLRPKQNAGGSVPLSGNHTSHHVATAADLFGQSSQWST